MKGGKDNECSKDLQTERLPRQPALCPPWWFDVMYEGKRWRMRVDE
jgi:hypothetical protein